MSMVLSEKYPKGIDGTRQFYWSRFTRIFLLFWPPVPPGDAAPDLRGWLNPDVDDSCALREQTVVSGLEDGHRRLCHLSDAARSELKARKRNDERRGDGRPFSS